MKTKLALVLFRLLGRCSLGLVRTLGAGLGRLMWLFNTREAQTTKINIRHCFPELSEQQQQRLAKASMVEFGKTVLEIPLTLQRSPGWARRKVVKSHNQHLLQDALAEDRGVIVITPHFGNWEVVCMELSARTAMTAMYEPSGYAEMDAIVKESRSRLGANLVPTDKRGVMALIKTLKTGGCIGILPDQQPDRSGGEFAPFFGMQALTMSLVHKLIKRTGARAVYVYGLRVPGGFELFYVDAEEHLYQDDGVGSLTAMNGTIEQLVRSAPEQYQWEYKRFKARPTGEPKIYPKGQKKKRKRKNETYT